jgi:phospholipid/cholesterol/gamma-HCH transport system substrate-binding protein
MAGGTGRKSRRVNPTLVGTIAVFVFLALVWFGYEVANGIPGVPYHDVRAEFRDVSDLRVGNGVRVDSVRVGQVSAIGYHDGLAVVTLQLPPGYKVYRNARARIYARNALGVDFVELNPGSPGTGPLASNVITVSHTRGLVTYDRIVDIFRPKTAAALGEVVRSLGAGVGGHGPDLSALLEHAPGDLADLSTIGQTLSAPATDLPGFLASTELLASRFQGLYPELSGLVEHLAMTLQAVNAGQDDPLRTVLDQAPATLAAARPALAQLGATAASASQTIGILRPGLSALGTATPPLESVLSKAIRPLQQLVPVSVLAVPAVRGLTTTARRLQGDSPLLADGVEQAAVPLQVLAPYAPAISSWFTYARSATNEGDANGNWLRFIPVLGLDNVAGVLPIEDPLTCRNPFPAPGQVASQHGNLAILGGCHQ